MTRLRDIPGNIIDSIRNIAKPAGYDEPAYLGGDSNAYVPNVPNSSEYIKQGGANPRGYGSGGGSPSSPSSPGTPGKSQEQIIAEQKAIADAQAKANAEAEKIRQANAQANLRGRSLSSTYQTKEGKILTATEFNKSSRQRESDRQAYTDYKKLEAQTLARNYNEAYKTYRSSGLSENEARYKASQWRRATQEDIKASGGITTYPTQEEKPVNISIEKTYITSDKFNKPIKYKDESFFAGRFVSESPTGRGSTAYIRQPTSQELEKMDTTKGVSKFIFGEKLSENLLTANVQDLERRYKQSESINKELSKVTKELTELEKKGDTEGYNKKYNEYELLTQRFKNIGGRIEETNFRQPTIKTGLFGMYVDRNINELNWISGISGKPITSISKPIGMTIGGITGGTLRTVLPKEGVYTKVTPEQKFNMSLPYQVRGTSFNENNIFITPTTEIKVPKTTTRYLTSSQGEAVGKFVGDISPYFIPVVGTSIFYGENIERLGQNAAEQKSATKGVVEWFKESPIESTIAVGIPLFQLGKVGANKLKLTKESKYLTNPELKIVDVKTREVKNILEPEKIIKPKVKVSKVNEAVTIEINPKYKGSTTTTEIYPSTDLMGTVQEVRDTGKIGIDWIKGDSFWSSKLKIGKKLKEFEGEVSIADDIYREVIPYGKDIKKVTTIDKSGKGTVELIKDGKVISKQKIESGINFLKDFKTRTSKLRFNKDEFNPLSITETKVNKKLINREVKDLEGNKVLILDNQLPNLKSEKLTGQIESTVSKAEDIKSGQFSLQQDIYGYSDVIRSGKKTSYNQMKSSKGDILVKKTVSPEIVYGIDKDIDKTGRIIQGDKTIISKLINPKVNRQITEGSNTRMIFGYVNPESKQIKNLLNIKQQKVDRIVNAIREDTAQQIRLYNLEKAKELSKKSLVKSELVSNPKIYVSPPKLKGASPINKVSVPVTTKVVKNSFAPSGKIVELGSLGRFESLGKLSSRLNFEEDIKINQLDQRIISLPLQESKVNLDIKQDTKQDIKLDTQVKSLNLLKSVEEVKSKIQQKNIQNEIQIQNQVQQQQLKLNQKLEQKQQQQFRQAQKINQLFKQRQQPQNKTPIKTIIKIPIKLTSLNKALKQVKENPELFKIFATKGGKDIERGTFKTQREAELGLKNILKKELRAGGFLTKGKNKLKATELREFGGGEFRLSKTSPYKVIQKKERRFGTKAETSEAQFFRKGKSSLF